MIDDEHPDWLLVEGKESLIAATDFEMSVARIER